MCIIFSIFCQGALLYGGEYHFSSRSKTIFGKSLYDQDAPCAVCRSPMSSALMIPGRNRCYDDWHLEYSGYLVGGSSTHPATSEFICLDEDPEMIPGGEGNDNGKLFFLAEVRCGSLKCPPYVNGSELTCVVCAK